ncbi:MAG TPA: cell envelope integrity protein TolA [Verrucomicrobiae bacterium]
MSLQRKCFTASAVMHGLLLLLVFIGSAFIPHKPKTAPTIEFEVFTLPDDFKLIESGNTFSGGDPNARKGTQIPQPQPPAPKPEPQKQEPKPVEPKKEPEAPKVPEPKPEAVKPPEKVVEQSKPKPEPDIDFTELFKKPKPEPKKKPVMDFKAIQANAKNIKAPADSKNNDSQSTGRETQMAAAAFDDVRKSLAGKLQQSGSPNGTGDVDDVLGPGGPRVASYKVYLTGVFREAWVPPAKSSARKILVRIEIARDGKILDAGIVERSGDRNFDRAAEATLNRVPSVRPPPITESKVTYTFYFTPES